MFALMTMIRKNTSGMVVFVSVSTQIMAIIIMIIDDRNLVFNYKLDYIWALGARTAAATTTKAQNRLRKFSKNEFRIDIGINYLLCANIWNIILIRYFCYNCYYYSMLHLWHKFNRKLQKFSSLQWSDCNELLMAFSILYNNTNRRLLKAFVALRRRTMRIRAKTKRE